MPSRLTTFHEGEEHLAPTTRDLRRAIVSLMEELEAVDWYQQRMDAARDAELRDIKLRHNRDEEKEHAAMVLEWIRRRDPGFDTKLRAYLGDFVLSVGGDLSVGYRLHDREAVHLFCVETIGAQTATPEAVCTLAP